MCFRRNTKFRDCRDAVTSVRALADVLGISKSECDREIQRGMPKTPARAIAWREKHPKRPRIPAAKKAESGHSADLIAYAKSRAERESHRAEFDRIELERARGKYVDVDEVAREHATINRMARDAVLAVPARLKDQLAAESDAFAVHDLLTRELEAALASIGLRDDESDDDED